MSARRLLLAAGLALSASGGAALAGDPALIQVIYHCERGVEIPATYVNAGEASVVVLQAEGRQIALPQVLSASGARYGGNAGYQWWSKGDTARLSWFDPAVTDKEKGEEVTLFAFCKTSP
ncbi:MliC family protein [Pseudooceanicola sp. CBS1P-1]|uniref:Lysozyme inhibitor n=1 Tax=Pseudooceanicola albus TaxID=2692189 RepID=A0A6L7G9K4_9RHOB|nr:MULTISPECIES: MliC family protein [Pseudooceanicola]MBT9384450.1 MliC family protein [Pseudooceanicola endophyticus]MXN20649.1 lysozyme inhibitor [Pseudooceanicola albus]